MDFNAHFRLREMKKPQEADAVRIRREGTRGGYSYLSTSTGW